MRGDAGFPVRLHFAKRGKVRFISHRDLARAFERAFRIEELPLAFTQGFSPRPKVSFGLALAVAYESDAEYLDLELAQPLDVAPLPERLTAVLPEGISVTAAAALADRVPALQESVTSVEYRMSVAGIEPAALRSVVELALASDELTVTTTRKGKRVTEDVRPSINRLAVVGDEPAMFERPGEIHVEVSTKPRGARPGEVISVLRDLAGTGAPTEEDRVRRICQWIERDGERLDPLVADRRLSAPAGAAAHALEVCA